MPEEFGGSMYRVGFDRLSNKYGLCFESRSICINFEDRTIKPIHFPHEKYPDSDGCKYTKLSFLVCTMLLSMNSVTKEKIIIDERLQKARIKNKKSKLRDYIIVTQPKISQDLGGTHASPLPHWRRGHTRHFRKDGMVIKKVGIEPMLINAKTIKVPDDIPSLKNYIVKK
jgi:hypothetical protein